MNKELELKLVEKFPHILCDYGGDKMNTCMHWGMECDDGWYDLLNDLLEKLDYMSKTSGVQVIAEQIKEKFGTLRFYFYVKNNTDSELNPCVDEIIQDIISHAEARSAHICEKTGNRGVLCSQMGWLKTLCKEEADKIGYVPIDGKVAKHWDDIDNEVTNTKQID